MWVLVASDRAFDTPCLWRVFQISCWNRLIVRASATNSWSRERRAQAIQPARSCSPRRPFGGEDRAELFLEQVGAVEGGVRGSDRGQALSLVFGEVVQGRPPARYPRYADPFPTAPHRTGHATYHRTRLSSVQFRESCHVGRP